MIVQMRAFASYNEEELWSRWMLNSNCTGHISVHGHYFNCLHKRKSKLIVINKKTVTSGGLVIHQDSCRVNNTEYVVKLRDRKYSLHMNWKYISNTRDRRSGFKSPIDDFGLRKLILIDRVTEVPNLEEMGIEVKLFETANKHPSIPKWCISQVD